jgi:hypothetical protein
MARKTVPASPSQLNAWLRSRMLAAAHSGKTVSSAWWIRTSGRGIAQWEESKETTFAGIDRTEPDIAEALALGFDIIRRDAIGAERRQELGDRIFVLKSGHATGGKGNRELGVILHVGATFFFYVLDTARTNNIEVGHKDEWGNALTEILRTVVRGVSEESRRMVGPDFRFTIHARELGRVVRSEAHAAPLRRTLEYCKVLLIAGPARYDFSDANSAAQFGFGAMVEQIAVEAIIRGLHRPEVVIQATGGFYEDIKLVPFTHGATRTVETTRTGIVVETVNPHRLAVTADLDVARTQLRVLVDCVLGSVRRTNVGPVADWSVVGELAAELGLMSRGGETSKHNQSIAQVLASKSPGERAESAKGIAQRLFSESWISGWRTGSFRKLVRSKVKVDLFLDVPIVDIDGIDYYECQISMPLPDGGWGVTDEEWDQVLDVRYPGKRGRCTPGGSNPDGMILPLGDIPAWTVPDRDVQGSLRANGHSYSLLERPLVSAHARGQDRAWKTNEHAKLARLRPNEIHVSIGNRVLAALESLEMTPASIAIALPPRDVMGDTGGVTRRDLEDATEHVETQRDRVVGIQDDLDTRRGRAKRTGAAEDLARRDQVEQRLATAETDLAAAERALAELEADAQAQAAPTEALVSEGETAPAAEVSSATAELMAVALTKCARLAPPWLHMAAAMYLHDFTAERCDTEGGAARVVWRCDLVVHDAETGLEARIPLTDKVMARGYGETAGRAQPEDHAWKYLYFGSTLGEIAQQCGLDDSGAKNSYVYSNVIRAMRDVVPDPARRAAVMHCPIPATRRAVWGMVTEDERAVELLDRGFVRHIAETYASRADKARQTWCQTTHDLPRAIATYLADRGGSAPMVDILEDLGVGKEAVLRLTRTVIGRRGTAAAGLVAFFQKNFGRAGTATAAERLISLRTCPHTDCPHALRHKQPAWCTIILWVPETEVGHGVLCPSCLRLPVEELAGVRFPADYKRPWNGRFGPGSKTSARKERASTYIQHGALDPGPETALSDTGCRPRRDDTATGMPNRLKRPSTEIKKTPFGGRRFYAHGLNETARERLRQHLGLHGGLVAVRLVPSVAAMITTPGADDDRITQARAMGIPVHTLQDFLRSQPPAAPPMGSIKP